MISPSALRGVSPRFLGRAISPFALRGVSPCFLGRAISPYGAAGTIRFCRSASVGRRVSDAQAPLHILVVQLVEVWFERYSIRGT